MRQILSLLILVTLLGFMLACGEKPDAEPQTEQEQTMQAEEGHGMETEMASNMVVDPVCGMKIEKENAAAQVEHKGETYYFCMEDDKVAFEQNPEKYLAANQ